MVDTQKLRNAIKRFEFDAGPNNGDRSRPATIGDIKKLQKRIAEVLSVFVDELEQEN